MLRLAEYCFVAGTLAAGLALASQMLAALAIVVRGGAPADLRLATARAHAGPTFVTTDQSEQTRDVRHRAVPDYATLPTWLALVLVGAALILRAVALGHGPFANMYEFSIACGWGILAAQIGAERRRAPLLLGIVALALAMGLFLFAIAFPPVAQSLMPALRNNLLLTVHVAVAIVAYGTFAIAFAAAALALVRARRAWALLPDEAVLERLANRAVVVGFPFLTLTILLGGVWAEIAWGSYWSWDPKETAALVTWLIYGAYLHARVARGWRGTRSSWLLVAGFGAVVFTYLGNLFLGGLHTYSGLG
jgi:cytochrome c-type biogenesis protein CcsB